MKTFQLEVITPDSSVFEGAVGSVVAPGYGGSLGILANHAPLLTPLETGALTVKLPDGKTERLFVSGGFLEVENNHVRVLADVGERVSTIDLERAKRAEERARRRLKERQESDFDLLRAEMALQRALLRQRLARDGNDYR